MRLKIIKENKKWIRWLIDKGFKISNKNKFLNELNKYSFDHFVLIHSENIFDFNDIIISKKNINTIAKINLFELFKNRLDKVKTDLGTKDLYNIHSLDEKIKNTILNAAIKLEVELRIKVFLILKQIQNNLNSNNWRVSILEIVSLIRNDKNANIIWLNSQDINSFLNKLLKASKE